MAGLDRRFLAFALDRVLIVMLCVLVGALVWAGTGSAALTIGTAVAVDLASGLALAVLTSRHGGGIGKSLSHLRVVQENGDPLSLRAAVIRGAILGVATLPTFGLGLATLAWTAVADATGQRRGWHDLVVGSVVLDVRAVDDEEELEEPGPRHVVNLTAMRLVPPAVNPSTVTAPGLPPVPRSPDPEPRTTSVTVSVPAPGAGLGDPTSAASPAPRATLGSVEAAMAPPPPAPAVKAASREAAATLEAGRTVARSARRNRSDDASAPDANAIWRVVFDSGETFVVEGLTLIGRRPEPRSGETPAHRVALKSPEMSVSKTHAQVTIASDGVLVVLDRGSTNGTVLHRKGVSKPVSPGKSTTLLEGDRVQFGDREMTVVRED